MRWENIPPYFTDAIQKKKDICANDVISLAQMKKNNYLCTRKNKRCHSSVGRAKD